MRAKPEEIVSVLREEIQNYDTRVRRDETGTVLEVGDGIATVYGLDQAVYGELVELDTGVKGMVLNLARDSVGVVLLGSEAGVREGTVVRRTGRAADVPVGDGLIGRVVDVLGQPIDGLGPIETTETRPIEHEASGVVSRADGHHPAPEGTGRHLHLRSHRPEGIHRGPHSGHPEEARGHGLLHHRVLHCQRIRPPPVHRPLLRSGHGRVFHGQGEGRAHRL